MQGLIGAATFCHTGRFEDNSSVLSNSSWEEDSADSDDDMLLYSSDSKDNKAEQCDTTLVIEVIESWFLECQELVNTCKLASNKGLKVPVLTREEVEKDFHEALYSGVNSSRREKLKQLETHEQLHLKYESGELHHCQLSYYLKATVQERHVLLAWMGSSMVSSDLSPEWIDDVPKIAFCLAKFPEGTTTLSDKGFWKVARLYPFLLLVLSPVHLLFHKARGY
jgi:hypothetical protein